MIKVNVLFNGDILEGELETSDIFICEVRLLNGDVIEVCSDDVTFVNLVPDKKLLIEYLEHMATYYTEADIPDVERSAIFSVVDEIKKRL